MGAAIIAAVLLLLLLLPPPVALIRPKPMIDSQMLFILSPARFLMIVTFRTS